MFDPKLKPEMAASFYSFGYACQSLQIAPGQLGVLMEAAGVKFAQVIDGVPMLDGHGFLAVVDKLKEVADEIKAVEASAATN